MTHRIPGGPNRLPQIRFGRRGNRAPRVIELPNGRFFVFHHEVKQCETGFREPGGRFALQRIVKLGRGHHSPSSVRHPVTVAPIRQLSESVVGEPGVVAESEQVIQFWCGQIRRTEKSGGLDGKGNNSRAVAPYLVEDIQIGPRYRAPDHVPAIGVGPFSHAREGDLVVEKINGRFGDGLWVSHGNQYPPAIGEQLLSVPVRCGDHGLASAHGIG